MFVLGDTLSKGHRGCTFPREFFGACFEQDEQKILCTMKKLDLMNLSFDLFCVCWAITMARMQKLDVTERILCRTAVGEA